MWYHLSFHLQSLDLTTAFRSSSPRGRLNIYNFQKVHYGPLKGGYTHKFLVKGHPHLCEEIKRESSSRHAAAVAASAVAVPSLKQVVTFESTRGHNDSSAILSMPTRTWAIQQQGEGDFVRAPAAARSSCSNSTSSQLFDTTVDEIAAFATSIIGNNRANNELSYDATPLPFQPEPQASSSSMSMMGTPNSTGVRRGSSTVPNILDKEDIAYFKNLFQPGDVSQEKEIMETFFLDGTNNQQKPQLSASTVAPPLAPSMPQQHHRQQPVMMPPPPAFRQQHQAAVAPAAALPPQQQPTPVMSYTVQPFAPRDVAPPATTTGVSPLMASAAVSEYNFPRKLYRLLQDCDTNPEYQSICSWLADGKQFKIHNKKRFVDTILPHYFDQTQYASFRRQLNMYSFVRQSMSTYANPYFVRGRHELLDHVVRKCCCRSSSKKG